ncbi:MAG TPA: Smr/MutS family protein [Candidatus Krumholzibacteriaceae bacterium]|nr:Smr/MutS family protein [Candidatus Krumholzibacteriaceae bacterium]
MHTSLMEEEFFHTSKKLEFDSVLGIIAGYARSERAREKIYSIRPLKSTEDIERNQREVFELVSFLDIGKSIPIAGWEDSKDLLEEISSKGTIVENRKIVQIAQGENRARKVKEYFSKNSENFPVLSNYSRGFDINKELADRILSVIGDDYEIVDDASKRLSRLRSEIRSVQKSLRKRFADFAAAGGGGEGREFVTVRGNRYVVSIARSSAADIKGIVHHESSSGASVFIEPLELIEDNNRLEALFQDERKEIFRILRDLTEDICEKITVLEKNQDILCKLDIISASADFARQYHCSSPYHSSDGRLILRQARHPLLQKQLEEENKGKKTVGLDLEANRDLKVIVISGPNAGGKTVVLKTIGLIILMDRSGLLVPAMKGTEIPNYNNVFVDIGDDQSIKKSLSTFSSRVLRIKRILSVVSSRSIVIIDEIGDGTSHEEGQALAEAVLTRLKGICGRVLVTTHFTGLKGWAHRENGVINATMVFDPVDLKPLYKLKLGVPGRSWGLETARRLGLDPDIVDEAGSNLDDASQDLEELLAYLEVKRQLLEKSLRKSEDKEKKLTDLAADYGRRLDDLNKNIEKYKNEARVEALKVVSDARADIEGLVNDIRATQADKKSIKRAKEQVSRRKRILEERVKRDREVQNLFPGDIKQGNWVKILSLGKEAKVISKTDSGKVFVELEGGIRVETNVGDLLILKKKADRGKSRKINWAASADPVYPEIMIRGLERVEALEKIDRLIDRAVLQGLPSVRIIHGIGKGILKRAVYNRLRDDPRVKEIHPGEAAIGGDGVAVVELK